MIHAIRKVARAIHRRSVWQVLLVYLLGSWAGLEGVDWLTRTGGLPAWTPTMAFVLAVIMLPLVLATAAVQGGLPGLRIEDEIDPNELVGRTPDQVHVVPEAHPLHDAGLFTWRNTILGGVTSAALLLTSVVAYMTMWAFGIGPVGSLLAQGVIQDQDLVVLDAFRGSAADAPLADLVTETFRLELERSSVVALSSGEGGGRLIVAGEITRRGPQYVVAARISVPDGPVLARFQETATATGLLASTVHLTERLRERMGEPLRTIREAERLAPVASESPEALDFLLQAARAADAGDAAGGMALLRLAVTRDPGFGVAWHRLGVLAEEVGDLDTAREAYQTLVDLWTSVAATERTVGELRVRLARLQ